MPPEARLVRRIQEYLISRRARPFKIMGNDEGLQETGIPDLLVCYFGQFIGIEVKQPGGRPSPRQLYVLRQIDLAGGITAVVSSLPEVKELLDDSVPPSIAAWIGGFFDGEGSLHIQHVEGRSGKDHQYPIVSIYQKDREPLDWIRESLDMGRVVKRKEGSHMLRVSRLRDVRRFLRIVEPHVRLKHRKAKIAEAWELLDGR
jgi:hypothetical protein